MKLWKQIKALWSGPTPERADSPHNDLTETLPDAAITPRPLVDTAGWQKKPILPPLAKPTLYFSGWGFDERAGHWSSKDRGKQTVDLEAAGRRYIIRRDSRHLLFRERGDSDERASLYLTRLLENAWSFNLSSYSARSFAEQIEHGKYGRWLLYVADNMKPDQCAFLAFDPNGSGFAIDERLTELAVFHWQAATRLSWRELLSADPETLRPLCADLFATQINPASSNPYIDPANLETIPHRFLSGSEEELRRLTLAIAHTEPGLFDSSLEPVTITYRAQTPRKRAGMTRAQQGKAQLTRGRVTSLCDLALRLNTFVGIEWEPNQPEPKRLGHFEKRVHKVSVTAHPPSAHERAESLLILADWLEGKVREEKRLRLLGIEEYTNDCGKRV